jgi:hypothetical protein
MKHTPFASFPLAERLALAEAVRRSGIAARKICVSLLECPEAAADGRAAVTLVTAPGWVRSYESGAGWIGRLERDLGFLRRRAA